MIIVMMIMMIMMMSMMIIMMMMMMMMISVSSNGKNYQAQVLDPQSKFIKLFITLIEIRADIYLPSESAVEEKPSLKKKSTTILLETLKNLITFKGRLP